MPSDEMAVNDGGDQAPSEAAAEIRLATLIINTARELKRSVPAPRAAPYFGLDNDVAYDPSVLESLSSRGIFRKYEFVLVVPSGLGGAARWLSRRLGCRILGVDNDVPRLRAARALNDAAGMADNVSFAAGADERLPFRERFFTHVWMIDPRAREQSPEAFAEAFRVLRSGAHFGMQVEAASMDEVVGLQPMLARVGFVDFSARTAVMMPASETTDAARSRLRAAVRDDDVRRSWKDETLSVSRPCYQVFCRRP